MSNNIKTKLKPVKEMTRKEELISKLTNRHAQGRAVQEWHSLIEIAKMDGNTVTEAFATVRDIVNMRQVMALEAIAGEMHAINQGVANFNVLQEMLHPELFDKVEAGPEGEAQTPGEETEDAELPDDAAATDSANAAGQEEPKGEQVDA